VKEEHEDFWFWVLCFVVWQKFADVTKECAASVFLVEE
jgi:hypothetical protein